MEKNKLNHFEQIGILIFMIITILFAIGVCFLEYYNQIKIVDFSLEDFEVTDQEQKANILNVAELTNYFTVEGQVLTDLKSYQINIGIEDANGNIRMHKTHFFKPMHQFRAVIPKKDVQGEKTIYIIYMCNDEKLVIKTHQTLGGVHE